MTLRKEVISYPTPRQVNRWPLKFVKLYFFCYPFRLEVTKGDHSWAQMKNSQFAPLKIRICANEKSVIYILNRAQMLYPTS